MFYTKTLMTSIFFSLLLTACERKAEFDLYGKWQSLNYRRIVIEFNENGNYSLFRDGNSQFVDLEDFGQLKTVFAERSGNWYTFDIIGESNQKVMTKGRIELVNENRIRIYFHKHHNILDLADEYHRTEDFNSFDDIMDSIL